MYLCLKRNLFCTSLTNLALHATENEAIEESARGGMWRGDGFGAEDVASETNVVDSLGQRLTLLIDNVIGGGGQRRVSLYCPYWIVNTTEHSLKYRQENFQSFVSGTVSSPERDGSKPVDGSNRNDEGEELHSVEVQSSVFEGLQSIKLGTVHSGRPGALKCLKDGEGQRVKPATLATLISEDLPLNVVSRLAFMFNFQEEVISLGVGPPRLCLQLVDTSGSSQYSSAWSSGFGLDSVGVTQIVG